MSAVMRIASRHRGGLVSPAAEVRRLRAELAAAVAERDQLAGQLAALVGAVDHDAEIRYRRQLCADVYAVGLAAGLARGYERCAADYERLWREAAHPAARGGPSHADLELLRWGPGGRDHFGDPRPGDFPGPEAAR